MPHSTASDPAEIEALSCLEQGTQKLEVGDVQAAKVSVPFMSMSPMISYVRRFFIREV